MSEMNIWINPLRCIPLELGKPDAAVSADDLLGYLFAPDTPATDEAFIGRYRELSEVLAAFPVAPTEPNILNKLVWPLRHAIGSYCLSNHLGAIALCGMVGEMVAILLWDISRARIGDAPLDGSAQRLLLGDAFEKLGQERRTNVLYVLKLIDADTKKAFDQLRTIRKRYLHFFSQPHDTVADDARTALLATAALVKFALAFSLKDGVIALRPELMAYLDAKAPPQSAGS